MIDLHRAVLGLGLAFALAVAPAEAAASSTIAIIKSDDLDAYDAPIDVFRGRIGRSVEVHTIGGDKAVGERLMAKLAADPPEAVFALGAKAAWLVSHQLPQVPMVHAMVLDPSRYGIDGPAVTGIRMQPPPDLVLAQLQLLAPDVKRLGIVLSTTNNDPMIGEAIQAARNAGYTVIARRVGNERDVRAALRRMPAEVDAVWLLPDPVVVTPRNFQVLQAEALAAHLPVLAYSEGLVQAGALMCVAPDPDAVGRMAADQLLRHFAGENIGVLDRAAPEVVRVVLNRQTQEAIGLTIDPTLLAFVDEVLARPRRR